MFICLKTLKEEKISINVNKVMFFCETKKGSSLVLEDGTLIDLNEPYDELVCRFSLYK